ncbi:hypothetical protein [Streptomyces triculaminicus]|uniref:hypothetical protein n=1 Tax=Streptomyces triculaminicus TaxID=2816232 RepID=UPI0037876335
MIITISTSAGPITVSATEPVPGLHVYEIPSGISPNSPYRWVLTHHEGQALASFVSEQAAGTAAEKVAPLADWTRNAMTVANEVGPSGMSSLTALLVGIGGQHPNA